jgi:hypothetical protein
MHNFKIRCMLLESQKNLPTKNILSNLRAKELAYESNMQKKHSQDIRRLLEVERKPPQDIGRLLEVEFDKRNIPCECGVILNDTTGTLMANAIHDQDCKVGVIVGTGSTIKCKFL